MKARAEGGLVEAVEKIKGHLSTFIHRLHLEKHLEKHRKHLPYVALGLGLSLIYAVSRFQDGAEHVYHTEQKVDFKDARILGSQADSLYEGKERLLLKSLKELQDGQQLLRDTTAKIQGRLEGLEKEKPVETPAPNQANGMSSTEKKGDDAPKSIRVGDPPENLEMMRFGDRKVDQLGFSARKRAYLGKTIVSFPVKENPIDKTPGIVLPSGSYVKGKLMTGVEAPEGRTYPALVQLDYAYIIPNHKRLDLSGCFMIVKSQGDLSTERVQMQATKLSCVSKNGKMFERETNGFIADDEDNSFAVMGSVSSKQDRVATMAFLSSIVEGVSKAIQQAQTTQSMNPLGGSSSVVTGDQLKYIGAGGAANAASLVTQWYLKQAENLLPTINVGSGQNVWVVMQDSVKLPTEYFRKNVEGGSSESVYSYFTRVSE